MMTSSKDISQWEEAPLNELLSVLETGARPKGGVDRYKTGVPSLGGEHLTADGKFFLRNLKFIPDDFAAKLARGRITRGDVLIVKDGATTGKCVLVSESFPLPKAYINEHVFLCRFWSSLDSRFFAYFLRSELGQKRILDNFRGAAQGGIPQSFAENTLVPVAPTAEQKRIADKLDTLLARVDACREHLDRVPGILKRFRQAVLAAAVSGQLTEDVEIDRAESLPLSKVVERVKTGPFGSALHKSDYITNGIPIVNPMHINEGKITPSHNMSISRQKANELSEYRLIRDDIVLARRGVMGRCAVVKGEQEGWLCGSGSMLLHPTKQVLPEYLQIYLSSPDIVRALEADSVGSTMSNLNQKILLDLVIRVPRVEIQQKIIQRVECLFAYADRLESRYQIARKLVECLRPALLALAFRGELVPKDPNDEPASVLLDRIRAEREARSKESGQHPKPARKITGSKVEGVMRKLSEITPTHLSDILKENGSMLPERLWAASELEIEDFYDQLKDEELKGLLKEIRNPINDLVVMLEAL